ncbi:MAG: cytochrome c [Vicinamibacterales bacterium]
MKNRYVLICAGLLALVSVARAQDAGPRTVWDGVYSDGQAERGAKLYSDQCASCHGAEMKAGAGAPSLAGPEFTFGWDKKSLGGLFEFIQQNMPPGQAGSLKDQDYVDIVAAILKRNAMPPSASSSLGTSRADLDKVTFIGDKP